ncbi:MAG TPA: neutral zinc metallopeptidase [Pirellulaceae bacterium]|nr:neutral zinc metallopeptidase [Pirellulaceae bacterium]
MRWRQGRRSENVDDRRGQRRAGPGIRLGGVGGIVILLLAVFLVGPERALNLLQQNGGAGGGAAPVEVAPNPQEEELVDFVRVVLGTTEDVWREQFRRLGREYREPKLVIFRDAVDSACGTADSAVGPFYCPGDETLYIDLSFFDELKHRFEAPGDFAQAYVIAHEVGHHVQNLLGATDFVHAKRGRVSDVEYNQYSVRLELQADFYAGVWAHHADRAQQILESGDVEEALGAASAIGDDNLQKQSRGYVTPDSFTHGTSEQRVRWFRLGLQTGDIERGNTFNAPSL